jgi:hypothetical protein
MNTIRPANQSKDMEYQQLPDFRKQGTARVFLYQADSLVRIKKPPP